MRSKVCYGCVIFLVAVTSVTLCIGLMFLTVDCGGISPWSKIVVLRKLGYSRGLDQFITKQACDRAGAEGSSSRFDALLRSICTSGVAAAAAATATLENTNVDATTFGTATMQQQQTQVAYKRAHVIPVNPERYASTFDWCDCGTGLKSVLVWPEGKQAQNVTLQIGSGDPDWLIWDAPVAEVNWLCDGMTDPQTSRFDKPVMYWSLQHTTDKKGSWLACDKLSGRLRFVGWQMAKYHTSVPYTSGEHRYSCIKIPVLLRTRRGTILAFAEARKDSCSDFAWTDLVVKRSEDGGHSWSKLKILRSESGPGLPHTVIGNAAPVQLSQSAREHPLRILVPHTRNNSDVWLMFSDDDGLTWSTAQQLPNATLPEWAWVGIGPPGSIQLRSGRIVVPCYHGPLRANLLNNKVHGHVMLSDDEGTSWRLASVGGFGAADKFSNENQAVELSNGSVLISARSLANPGCVQRRLQTLSNDGGETFGPTRFVPELPQPIQGCEGSIVKFPVTGELSSPQMQNTLLVSGPDSTLLRTRMSLWTSTDEGASWSSPQLIDHGTSGYSSLQIECISSQDCDALLLYEQSDTTQLVMKPDRFIFRRIPMGSQGHDTAQAYSNVHGTATEF